MRRNNREDYDRHRDRGGHSPDWERRSRDRKAQKNWQREPIEPHDRRRQEKRGHLGQSRVQENPRPVAESVAKINRKEMSPFFVRVFYSINKENIFESNGKVPQQEQSLYLWMDSSLREISQLLRAHLPAIRTKQRFQFWRVFKQEGSQIWAKEELGSVFVHRRADKFEEHFLQNSKFSIGNYIDVSIYYK